MRKLKFRCWDTSQNKLRYDVTGFEHYNDNEMSGIFLNGDYFEIATNPTMQFTGILDKNGKEIYEGDILQIDSVCFVKWNDNMATYDCRFNGETKSLDYILSSRCDIEIIGNIYENPTLL